MNFYAFLKPSQVKPSQAKPDRAKLNQATYQIFLCKLDNMFQPIEYTRDNKSTIIYLKIDTNAGVSVKVTDIYNFSLLFQVSSELEFFNMTYQMNNLSKSDLIDSSQIVEKFKEIGSCLKPILQHQKIVELSDDLTTLTLIHSPFKYSIPLSKLSATEELKLIKSIYQNLEKFSNLQNELIFTLDNQITNKNKIMLNIADAYVQKCTYEKEPNLFKSKYINKLFVNRSMLNYAQTTVPSCIDHLGFPEKNNVVSSKNESLWKKIVSTSNSTAECTPDSDNTEVKEVKKVMEDKLSPRKTTKRKLQGLLRREQKRKNAG